MDMRAHSTSTLSFRIRFCYDPAVVNKPVVISLGRYCATAFHLGRLGLQERRGPLDWMGTDESGGLLDLIENDFKGLMDLKHLKIQGQHHGNWILRDQQYRIRSVHDFPIRPGADPEEDLPSSSPGRWSRTLMGRFKGSRLGRVEPGPWLVPGEDGSMVVLASYAEGIRRIRRRTARIRAALQSRRPLVLLRNEDSMEEILALHKLMREIRGRRPFLLLACGPDPEFRREPGIENLACCWMPEIDSTRGPDSWQGSHAAWDAIPGIVERFWSPGS